MEKLHIPAGELAVNVVKAAAAIFIRNKFKMLGICTYKQQKVVWEAPNTF